MKTELIVALDVSDIKEAKKLIKALKPVVKFFKIGSILFTSSGPGIVGWLKKNNLKVFLDLKLHDIPNTVANTARLITKLGVSMFTIHASGGQEMMRSCVDAVKLTARNSHLKKPDIVAVTILTSSNPKNAKQKVLELAKQAISSGVDGIVCSVQEAAALRKKLPKNAILVCPGIRSRAFEQADQKRVATPLEAKRAKVNFIVVGRPIIESSAPLKAALDVLDALKDN